MRPTLLFTYNNLLGNEGMSGGRRKFRAVHNLYWTQQWSGDLISVLNITGGTQSNSVITEPDATATFIGGYATVDYAMSDRWNATLRLESFSDPDGALSGLVGSTGSFALTGLIVSAVALSGQYRPVPNAFARVETRYARLDDRVALFQRDGSRVDGRLDGRLELLLTLGVDFGWERKW